MRRVAILLFVTTALLGGTVFAQGAGSNMFAGVSVGYENEGGFFLGSLFPVAAHFGINNVGIQNLGVRGDVAYQAGNVPSITFGVDALYSYPVMTDLSVYGGVGPSILLGMGLASGVTWFGVRISAGGEYMVTSNIGVTAEANATPYFNNGSPFLFGLSLGANYHF